MFPVLTTTCVAQLTKEDDWGTGVGAPTSLSSSIGSLLEKPILMSVLVLSTLLVSCNEAVVSTGAH